MSAATPTAAPPSVGPRATWGPPGVALRTLVAALLGAAAAHGLAMTFGWPVLLPVAIGWTLALLWLGPQAPGSTESWLGRGALAVGLAAFAARLILAGHLVAAWPLAVGGLLVAAVDPVGPAPRLLLRAAAAAAAMGLAFLVGHHTASWGGEALWMRGALVSLVLAAGAFAASRLEVTGPLRVPRAREPLPRPQDAAPLAFATDWTRLEEAAEQVERLLVVTAKESPTEAPFVQTVRERVTSVMAQARDSLRRWRKAGTGDGAQARVETARAALEDSRGRLEGTQDAPMRRELSLAVERQERTLATLQSLARARATFAARLGQVAAGLELLAVTLEQALTLGGGIDSSDLDGVIEVLGTLEPLDDQDLQAVDAVSGPSGATVDPDADAPTPTPSADDAAPTVAAGGEPLA